MSSSVITARGRGTGVRFPAGVKDFSLPTASRPALGQTLSPIQLVPRALSLEVKRKGRQVDLSPSSAEVRNGGAIPLLPHTFLWRGDELIKHSEKFIFALLLVLYNRHTYQNISD
jgi:hypothetical protein